MLIILVEATAIITAGPIGTAAAGTNSNEAQTDPAAAIVAATDADDGAVTASDNSASSNPAPNDIVNEPAAPAADSTSLTPLPAVAAEAPAVQDTGATLVSPTAAAVPTDSGTQAASPSATKTAAPFANDPATGENPPVQPVPPATVETEQPEVGPALAAPIDTDAETALPDSSDDDLSADTLDSLAEQSGSFFDDISWSGYLKNETAYRYNEPRSVTKIRNTAYLKGTYTFSPRYRATFGGWVYYDAVYDLFDYDTIAARQTRNADQPLAFLFNLGKEKDSTGVDLREFFLDMSYDKMDIRVGRQFVVWGVLEGVRIVDEVQPIDFRELIMPDLLDYRIPLWMAKIDYYRGDDTYELLYIPDIRFHEPAPPGSEWELLQKVPGTIYPKRFDPLNPDIGLRYSTKLWDADVTLSYLYTYDQFNTVFRRILLNQVNIAPEFDPIFTRINMYGGTFNMQMGEYILKGEMAYVTGKYFSIVDIDRNNDGYLDSLGEFKRDHLRWGLGVETNIKGMDASIGVTQWIIMNYDPAIVVDNYDTSINLFLRKEFPQKSMGFELLGIEFVNLHELYLNPRVLFLVTDHFKITTGLNLFYGEKSQFGVLANPIGSPTVIDQRSQFVGNFHDNNRAYVELKYSF